MRYILTMVLLVFSLGLYAETLSPVSVTNDTDLSYDSIDNDYQAVSIADFDSIVSFEFYDESYTGNTFSNAERRETLTSNSFCVNDVGKIDLINVNTLILESDINKQSTKFVYRRSRDGLMCFPAKLV